MPIDAPAIGCLSRELKHYLPVKIDKIWQPYPDEFIFSCFGSGASFKLLLSVHPQFGRFHLFSGTRENPINPSAFCMLLRKHLGGAKLVTVDAVPFERVARFSFETYEPIEGLSKKLIYLELTGRNANLILTTENDRIIDSWRRVSSARPGGRELLSDSRYLLPPSGGRWQPVSIGVEQFSALLNQVPADVPLEKFLWKHWNGLSALAIGEITAAAGFSPLTTCAQLNPTGITALYEAFSSWAAPLNAGIYEPACLYPEGSSEPTDCAAFAVHYPPQGIVARPVPNLLEVVAVIGNSRHEKHRFLETREHLNHRVDLLLEKARLKWEKQQDEAAAADKGDALRIAGELLITSAHQISKGTTEARLTNYYDPAGGTLTVALNPALTAAQNAQVYFKKYQKAKKGQLAIAEQLAKTQAVIEYLESIVTLIQNAANFSDLELVREELDQNQSESRLRPTGKGKAKPVSKKTQPAEPRRFTTSSGHIIWVGRNNLQNDRLTFKMAAPGDLWFHTQKIPGSHVILKLNPGTPLDDTTLNSVCQLAVYFSKARNSVKVAVDYTQRKHVKKPPGSKPGFVIYDDFKTAIITPDPVILSQLGVTSSASQ